MSFKITIDSPTLDELFQCLRRLAFATDAQRPKDAPILKIENRAPVSQHIEPSVPQGRKPEEPKPNGHGILKCSKCGSTDFANPQSRSRHENRCDGTDRSAHSRKAQREWKAQRKAKANGTAKGDYPCPVPDCAFGPFSTDKGLKIHNGRFHPEVSA